MDACIVLKLALVCRPMSILAVSDVKQMFERLDLDLFDASCTFFYSITA